MLLSTIQQEPELVATIHMACYVLHNILRTEYNQLVVDKYLEEKQLHEDDHAVAKMNQRGQTLERGLVQYFL